MYEANKVVLTEEEINAKKGKFLKAIKRLPKGFYPHMLHKFVNGKVSLTRKNSVKLIIEIPLKDLGSPFNDLHAVLSPAANDLVPVLVFVEPAVVLTAKE